MKSSIRHKLMCTLAFAFGLSIGSIHNNKLGWYDILGILLLSTIFYSINVVKFSPTRQTTLHKGS